jgi:hypothetical protein
VQPAAPEEAEARLVARGVGAVERAGLATALAAEVDVSDGQAAPEARVARLEDVGSDEARDEEALEDVARLDAAFREVAPALGVLEPGRPLRVGNAAIRLDPAQRVEVGLVVGQRGLRCGRAGNRLGGRRRGWEERRTRGKREGSGARAQAGSPRIAAAS